MLLTTNPKYVFFGTPKFATIILEKLIDAGMPPVALVCNPDRPVGRKQIITPPPTKQVVRERVESSKDRIKILQPANLKDAYYLLHTADYDVFIVAAYAKILPKEILEIPKLGTIGVHPSLLPKYRGPSPIQSVILAGEKETGASLFLMDEKVDSGPVISHQTLVIRHQDNYETLEKKLAELAGNLLIETLPRFVKGEITPLPQDGSQATYSKKFTIEDGYISPEDLKLATSGASPEKAVEIHQKTRALNPEPGAWTLRPFDKLRVAPSRVEGRHAQGKRVKLLEAQVENGKLVLKKIQEAGKKPVTPLT